MKIQSIKAYCLTVFGVGSLLSYLSCTPAVSVKQSPEPSPAQQQLVRQTGDTSSYVVSFAEKAQAERFLKALDAFLDRYPFGAVQTDTLDQYVRIRVLSAPELSGEAGLGESGLLEQVEQAQILEEAIAAALDSAQVECPRKGGKLTLYSPRSFWDDRLRVLTSSPWPFGKNVAFLMGQDTVPDTRVLALENAGTNRYRVVILDPLRSGSGRSFTSFDLVQGWTDLVRERPAEGMALFGSVRGIEGFCRGREAVISGFAVVDERTVELRLERPDPGLPMRLNSTGTVPPRLGSGPYVPVNAAGRAQILAAVPAGAGCLDTLSVVLGGDKEPFLSYSLGRLDAVTLIDKTDLDYARTRMASKGELVALDRDLYFLALRGSEAFRRYCHKAVDAAELLRSAARCEGEVISALSPLAGVPRFDSGSVAIEIPVEPVVVLYVNGDPVSRGVAEKIFADMSRQGVDIQIDSLDMARYQSSLLGQGYSIAVGFVAQEVLGSQSGRTRFAAMYFNNESDETLLQEQRRLVPLFSAQWYLFKRPGVGIERKNLATLYRDTH